MAASQHGVWLLCLIVFALSGRAPAHDRPPQPPEDAEPWPALKPSTGTAIRGAGAVYFVLGSEVPETLRFPRLANPVRAAYWLGDSPRAPLPLHPEPNEWSLRLTDPLSDRVPTVVLEVQGEPRLSGEPVIIRANDREELVLPAHLAVTHCEKLRYEPQPHKNTIGFWTNPDDWVEWHIEIPTGGGYEIKLLQGCGAGQGGSEVDIVIAPENGVRNSTLEYTVVETGHFQNFRHPSERFIYLDAGRYRFQLRPTKLAARAVMDVREVRLRRDVQRLATTLPLRPHVLIFFADDQGTLDAGCYGSRDLFTPHMDGLANDGVRFTQAYAHTVCCPARALLLTGRHPQRSGVNDWMQGQIDQEPTDRQGRNMSLEEMTLAEHLGAHGYRTALFGKWHLGGDRHHGPTTQGFEEFFGIRNGFIDNFNHYYLHREGYHDLFRGTEEVWRPGEYFPDLVTVEAERFLDRHAHDDATRSFFLYVAFNIPHYPEQSDAKFDQHYARAEEPRRSYGRTISTTDDRMGRILAKLDEYDLRDDTIVIWMSDNGHSAEDYQIHVDDHMSGYAQGHNYGANGGGGNTGKWIGHKATFYEGGLRVPAVISYPRRLPKGVVRDQIITAADWYPTVCDLCGIDPPDDVTLDGASLLPIIEEDADTHHDVLHWQWRDRWAAREGDWKLISLADETLLVSLADKNPETVNHAAEHAELVDRLTGLHEVWLADVMSIQPE